MFNSALASFDCSKEINNWLDKDVKIQSNRKILEIEYCPDNTCETYTGGKDLEKLCDYVLLYLFYESNYFYLKEKRKYLKKEILKQVEQRNKFLKCNKLKESIYGKCVVSEMKKKYTMRVWFRRLSDL